jgi:hypothetical protein
MNVSYHSNRIVSCISDYEPSQIESRKTRDILNMEKYITKYDMLLQQVPKWFPDAVNNVMTFKVELSRFNHKSNSWTRKGPAMIILAKDGTGYRILAHYLHGSSHSSAFNFRGSLQITNSRICSSAQPYEVWEKQCCIQHSRPRLYSFTRSGYACSQRRGSHLWTYRPARRPSRKPYEQRNRQRTHSQNIACPL